MTIPRANQICALNLAIAAIFQIGVYAIISPMPGKAAERQDPETGVMRWRNTSSRRVKRDWAQQSLAHRDTLTKLMARSGMDFTSVSTQGSLVKPLLRIFHARG